MSHHPRHKRDELSPAEAARRVQLRRAIQRESEQAMRSALALLTNGSGSLRGLAALRSTARSLQAHQDQTRVILDRGGYLRSIAESRPHLAKRITDLDGRRTQLRDTFERLMVDIDYVIPQDACAVEQVCREISDYLDELNRHHGREIALLQHSVNRDDGGEG